MDRIELNVSRLYWHASVLEEKNLLLLKNKEYHLQLRHRTAEGKLCIMVLVGVLLYCLPLR